MNVWLCPVKARNWRIIKKVKMFGVSRRAHKVFSMVKPRDLLVFHVFRPINGIVSIGKVTSQIFENHQDIWGKDRYPLRVNIEFPPEYFRNESQPIPLSTLIGAAENTEFEIEPYLRNVWITKITKKQFQNVKKYFV